MRAKTAIFIRCRFVSRLRPIVCVADKITCDICYQMLVLAEEADSRRDVLRQRRLNDKHYVYDRVFGEGSTQVRNVYYSF